MAGARQCAFVMRVGFMGPAHTFSEQAAQALAPGAAMVPLTDIAALFAALAAREADASIVPLENSQVGAVPETIDLLLALAAPLDVAAEVTLAIRFSLYVAALGPPPARLASHMMSFRQCAPWVAASGLPAEEVGSTGTALARAACGAEPGLAAIGPAGLAVAGLVEAECDLQGPDAFDTRFLLIAQQVHAAAHRSICALSDLAHLAALRARGIAVRATGQVGAGITLVEAEGAAPLPGRPLLLWR